MVDKVRLSSLRGGRYSLRASCIQQGDCYSSWEIDFDDAMGTMGDITLAELRGKLRCPKCNAPIATTLISLK